MITHLVRKKLMDSEICISNLVYEPSDDSYLVVDYIMKHPDEFNGKSIIDLGSGSGILSLFALKYGAKYVLAIDINPFAAVTTKCTLEINGYDSFDIINCDSLSCLRKGVPFDIVLFNPPYLPIDMNHKECNDWLSMSWCGGEKGVEVTKTALEYLGKLFLPERIFVVVSSLGEEMEVLRMLAKQGYETSIVNSMSFFFEEIRLVRGVING